MKGLSKFNLSITTRLILFGLPLIAIVSAIVWCPTITEFQRRETEEFQSSVSRQVEIIKKAIYYGMLRNQREDIQEVIDSVSRMEDTLSIRVIDRNKTIKVSSNREEIGRPIPEGYVELEKGEKRVIEKVNGRKVLILSRPIENLVSCYTAECHFHRKDEKVLGTIEVVLDFGSVERRVRNQGLVFASFGVIAVSSLFLVFYVLMRIMILKKVILLSEASKRVADGDLSVTVPFAGEGDEIGRLSEVFNNMVSELRRRKEAMDKELNGYRQSLIQAQKMEAIGLLAAGIAHDFNNLLTGIIGFSEMSLLRVRDEETKENLRRIIQTAERGSDLSRQILLIGRKVPPEKRPLNINIFINDSYKMLRRMVEERIELRTELKEGLPFVNADHGQLTQVLMNLVVNARDAIQGSGVIILSTDEALIDESYCMRHPEARPGHYVVLSVRDTGEGIPDEVKDRIFEPFFTTKEKGRGTGLGLSVTYAIVASHDGWISLYSEKDKGTEFRIYLPAMEESSTLRKEQKESIPYPISFTPSLILLVDDEEMIRDVGRSMLESLGYKVITASNGKEAVDIYKDKGNEVALVIMDLVMPVMDGLDAFRELKKINPSVKVIVSSGYSANRIDLLRNEGVAGFVGKPYRLGEMAEIVRKVIDEKR